MSTDRMTTDQWESIALLIDNCWQGKFDEVRSASYYTFLQRFSHADVMAGLHVLIEQGKPFVPSVPEIVDAVRALQTPGVPSWTEVWAALPVALKKTDTAGAINAMRNECGDVAAAFIQAEGVQRLRYVEFFDPDYGQQRIRELQQRWNEFADTAVERMRNGLALSAAGDRRGELGRSNFLAQIGDGA